MNGSATIGNRDTAAFLQRLYLRPDEAARAIGVSRRTLSAWQASRVIGYRRIGRTVLFSVADIQTAIDRYRIAPIGEPKKCKHRMVRIEAIPQSEKIVAGNTPTRVANHDSRRLDRIHQPALTT